MIMVCVWSVGFVVSFSVVRTSASFSDFTFFNFFVVVEDDFVILVRILSDVRDDNKFGLLILCMYVLSVFDFITTFVAFSFVVVVFAANVKSRIFVLFVLFFCDVFFSIFFKIFFSIFGNCVYSVNSVLFVVIVVFVFFFSYRRVVVARVVVVVARVFFFIVVCLYIFCISVYVVFIVFVFLNFFLNCIVNVVLFLLNVCASASTFARVSSSFFASVCVVVVFFLLLFVVDVCLSVLKMFCYGCVCRMVVVVFLLCCVVVVS